MHTVFVSGFYIDKCEVTKALWDEVFHWATNHNYSFEYAAEGKAPNHPAHTLSWYDALKWCNARSEREGRMPALYTSAAQVTVLRSGRIYESSCVKWNAGYRLPTEAEWEKAARGGVDGRRFPWGDTDTITQSQANYYSDWFLGLYPKFDFDVNPTSGYHLAFKDGIEPFTSPVGYFAPNGYGLYDMAGNVYEWCWDRWESSYYSVSPQSDPVGPISGDYRVFRGGGWSTDAYLSRTSNRRETFPFVRSNTLGFRTVLSQSQ